MINPVNITTRHCEPAELTTCLRELVANQPLLVVKIQGNTSFKKHDEAMHALGEVLRFMYLCTQSNATLTPSALVDSVWHEFILFTRSYKQFCEHNLGSFVHHQPSADRGNELLQYQQTIALYERYFGDCDETFWPRPQQQVAHCGPCENE